MIMFEEDIYNESSKFSRNPENKMASEIYTTKSIRI